MDTLQKIPHIRALGAQKLREVEKYFETVVYKEGEVIYRKEDKAEHMYFLVKGELVLLADDSDGLVIELERFTSKGSVVGAEILSAQKRRHRTFSAAAVSESEVLRLNRKGWKSVARVLKDGAKKIQRNAEQREALESIARKFKLFRSMSQTHAHQFMLMCGVKHFKPGEVIIRQNDAKHRPYFYVITAGRARVLVGDAVARDLKKGGYFGEISMMTGNPPTANVVVVGERDCVCLRIRKRFFDSLVAAEPKLRAEFHLRVHGVDAELQHIIRHEKGRKHCLNYADERYMRESMDFWLAVEDFEAVEENVRHALSLVNSWNTEAKVKAAENKLLEEGTKRIMETWVLNGAESEVPTEERIQLELTQRFKEKDFSFGMFKDAKDYVVGLIVLNFAGFKDSTHFEELLSSIGTYSFDLPPGNDARD